MKKLLTFTMICFALFSNFFSFAQEDISIKNEIDNTNLSEDNTMLDGDSSQETNLDDMTKIENTENIQDNNQGWASLLDVQLWFCNKWFEDISNTLKVAVSQWVPFKICLFIQNKWNIDADIEIKFVDKTLNVQWYELCNHSSKNIQNFISDEDLNDLYQINIPAQNYVIKEFNITFPIWINWEQKSCLIYRVINKNTSTSMLTTIYDKAQSMDFFVWEIWDIDNEIDINNINLYLDENKFLQLAFNIDNIWNLENQVKLHWTLSNMFWFKRDFEFNVWNIWVWWSLTWKIDLWPLPNYGWLFNISMTATATPFFSYNIDESTFDKDLLEPKDFTITTSYFQMPWIVIIILIFIIMFIIIAFRKPKKEVVYVQAPQWPMLNNWYQQPQYQAPQQNQYQQPQQPYQTPNQ